MRRPFKDSRPVGPFVETRSSVSTVLLTCDFEPSTEKGDLETLVNEVGSESFGGEVIDVRMEDTAVRGGEGIRVVYDTQINAVFKDEVDEFESRIETRLEDPVDVLDIDSSLEKITIATSV